MSYEWATGETTESIWVYDAGTYSVTVVDEVGCENNTSYEVEEGLTPLVDITGDTAACAGESIELTAQFAGGEGVFWSTGATTQTITVTESGEYCVTTVSFHGCEANDCLTVNAAEVPNISAGADIEICEDQSATLTVTGGTSSTSYTWYVDGIAVDTGMTIVVSPGVGITEYSVVATNENCSVSDEDFVKVYVYAYPDAGFTRDPAGDIAFGEEVQFTDTTSGNVTDWSWDFGDGSTSMLQNPSHDYEDPGAYWVELIASNNGCADTARSGLEVKIIIDIPNVFTPNEDGQNDQVWLEGTDINNINMTIFNRWGHSVYTSQGRKFLWDGKNSSGGDCEAGTYYYIIQMEHKDGNISEQTGFMTLIRNK